MTLDDQVLARPAAPAPEADVRSIFSQLKAPASEPRRIALVGTYTPRKCGIATFGNDVFEKLAEFHPGIRVDVYALDDSRAPLAYEGVAGTIAYDDPAAYEQAARRAGRRNRTPSRPRGRRRCRTRAAARPRRRRFR